MKIKDLEWKLGLFADAAVFDAESKEALRHARDIVAAVRASRDLPPDFNAKELVGEIWAGQVTDEAKAEGDGPVDVFAGHLTIDGKVIDVEFQAPAGATQVEKDAAFLAALAQQVEIDYLSIGECGTSHA